MKRSLIFLCFVTLSNAQVLSDENHALLVHGISGGFTVYLALVFSLVAVSFTFFKIKDFLLSVIAGRSSNISPESIIVTTKYGSPKHKLKKHGKNRVVI